MIERSLRRSWPLLLLSAGLLALLCRELWAPHDLREVAQPMEAARASPAVPVMLEPPSRANTAEIAARPPFSPSRRPQQAPAAATPVQSPPPPSLPNLVLVGTVVGPQATLAIVKVPGAPATQTLRTGQAIGGWNVARIEKNSILLRAGADEQELKVPPPSQAGGAIGGGGMGASPFRPGAATPR